MPVNKLTDEISLPEIVQYGSNYLPFESFTASKGSKFYILFDEIAPFVLYVNNVHIIPSHINTDRIIYVLKRGGLTVYEIYIGFCPRTDFNNIMHIACVVHNYFISNIDFLLTSLFFLKYRGSEYRGMWDLSRS